MTSAQFYKPLPFRHVLITEDKIPDVRCVKVKSGPTFWRYVMRKVLLVFGLRPTMSYRTIGSWIRPRTMAVDAASLELPVVFLRLGLRAGKERTFKRDTGVSSACHNLARHGWRNVVQVRANAKTVDLSAQIRSRYPSLCQIQSLPDCSKGSGSEISMTVVRISGSCKHRCMEKDGEIHVAASDLASQSSACALRTLAVTLTLTLRVQWI